MSRTNLILVAILIVQLGLAAVVYMGKSDASIAKLEPILELDATAVTKIEIFDKDAKTKTEGAPSIALDKSSGTWTLASHFQYPATTKKVSELITNLTAMKAREPIASKTSTHRKFAVSDDKYERRVIIHRSVGEPLEIYVGSAAGQRQTAIRLKGQEKVYGATGITAWGIAVTTTAWIDPAYFKAPGAPLSFTVKNANGEFEFRRDSQTAPWKRLAGDAEVPVPAGKELDKTKIDEVLRSVSNITLNEPADPATSFTAPTVTAKFKAGSADPEQVIVIGTEKENRLPLRAGSLPPVWVTKASLQTLLDLKGDELYRDPSDDPPAPPPGPPGGMQGLPPEILQQLQQQGIAPQ